MAKKKRSSGLELRLLNKTVPDVVAYTLLVALFILTVKVVQRAVGYSLYLPY
jgi:hypothetical protein